MKKRFLKVLIFTIVLVNIAMASIFVFHEAFDFTSSNSAIYILRGQYGGFEIRRDLFIEEADRLIFMVDMNTIFNYFMKGLAVAKYEPVMELTWDENTGVGDVKQYRQDGTIFSLSFSRFDADRERPKGLFIGGELPYGDLSRSKNQESSGFGYFDGENWHHIWCTSNEGFKIFGKDQLTILPVRWKYDGSRVLKNTTKEVMLESNHSLNVKDHRVRMNRLISYKAGNDYFVLKIKFENSGDKPLIYGYSWGDEPWVGSFGASKGDVGWYEEGLIWTEKRISPSKHKYVGYWDYGNTVAGEKQDYSGYANFVEWGSPAPSLAFLSNAIDECCDEMKPLNSDTDRVISLVWLNQILLPGESRTYTLALGMADVDSVSGTPKKPDTELY